MSLQTPCLLGLIATWKNAALLQQEISQIMILHPAMPKRNLPELVEGNNSMKFLVNWIEDLSSKTKTGGRDRNEEVKDHQLDFGRDSDNASFGR